MLFLVYYKIDRKPEMLSGLWPDKCVLGHFQVDTQLKFVIDTAATPPSRRIVIRPALTLESATCVSHYANKETGLTIKGSYYLKMALATRWSSWKL